MTHIVRLNLLVLAIIGYTVFDVCTALAEDPGRSAMGVTEASSAATSQVSPPASLLGDACLDEPVGRRDRIYQGLPPIRSSDVCIKKIFQVKNFYARQMQLKIRFYNALQEYSNRADANASCSLFFSAGLKLSDQILIYAPALTSALSDDVDPLLRARLEILNTYLRQMYLVLNEAAEGGRGSFGINKVQCLEKVSAFRIPKYSRSAVLNDFRNQLHALTTMIRVKWGARGLENSFVLSPQLKTIAQEDRWWLSDLVDYLKNKMGLIYTFGLPEPETIPQLSVKEMAGLYKNIVEFSKVSFDSSDVYSGIIFELETQEKALLEACTKDVKCLIAR